MWSGSEDADNKAVVHGAPKDYKESLFP